MGFSTIDTVIFVSYALLIVGIGLWVSRKKGKTSEDYFLAGKSLPWWAVGASLIAANISAEQFIGMSGSGFAIGLAIASYEWMAAITLIIVGKYFLPVFIEKGLYTIPEFIEKRFSKSLKTILAVFWIALFVFVNLTAVLYLGAIALDTIIGDGSGDIFMYSIFGLALFAAAYSLYGGLSAVAWTDVLQVVLLLMGGIITTIFALQNVAPDGSFFGGISYMFEQVPEKFSMVLEKGELITPNGKDAWWDLPGIAVLVGGLWVANLYYWGFNQYIIQRTLAAKSLKEAQKGIMLAAFLKLVLPFIIVIPGIVAYVMNSGPTGVNLETADPSFLNAAGGVINDNAAPWLIKSFIPNGLKGLVLAALAAAIVSSLASMLNSTATIFTMDIYKPYFGPQKSENHLVNVGRVTATIALIIAVAIAPQLKNLEQVFQYIQEYTGVVSPGILAVFMLGLFWRKTTDKAAIWGVVLSIPIALFFKVGPNNWIDSAIIFPVLPFMHQMMLTWIITAIIIMLISWFETKGRDHEKAIIFGKDLFKTSKTFNVGSVIVIVILVFLYWFFW